MAEFITELNDLFGGFKQRAAMVEAALRSPEVSFVLVTSPAPMSIQEVLFFSERLEESKMPRGAFVVNRFRLPPPGGRAPPSLADAAEAIARARLEARRRRARRAWSQAHADAVRLAALDALDVQRASTSVRDGEVPIVRVPELASDVHDLKNLGEVAETLMTAGCRLSRRHASACPLSARLAACCPSSRVAVSARRRPLGSPSPSAL